MIKLAKDPADYTINDPDKKIEKVKEICRTETPTPEQLKNPEKELVD
jgi:hypothetical protein